MSDEGSQEIQLRGKQLVFLAMSATVVAVVIFLCGVMVGRGVPTARQAAVGEVIEADPTTAGSAVDDTDPETLPVPAGGIATAVPLEYPEIVNDQPNGDSQVKAEPSRQPFTAEPAVIRPSRERPEAALTVATAPKPPAKPTPAAKPPPKPAQTGAKPAAAATAAGATPGTQNGFLVQVAAFQREGDATTVQQRLKRKGYPVFVTTASTSAGTWFRVRVGSYSTRSEAQAVAARLKREEQLEPWVTR